MSDESKSMWTKSITPVSKDKIFLRGSEWFALVIGIMGAVTFPVMFFVTYRQRSPDYSLLIWCPICAAFAWQMKKKLWPNQPSGSDT
jgi:hypothetical protein